MAIHRTSFSIAHKLALLAGLPVVGALVLAWIIVSDAQEQARSAAALGSVEDLAKLASRVSGTVHELQRERAHLAWHFGTAPDEAAIEQYARTNKALGELKEFLAHRDVSRLPARLARDLKAARDSLAEIEVHRKAAGAPDSDVIDMLTYYGEANRNLISAIAALMQLSDHGELLRTISTLVSVLQIKESASQEHGVLASVFERQEFAPGIYKTLVTLVTEHSSNERVLIATADDQARQLYEEAISGDFADKTAEMRDAALQTMDDNFGVEAKEWFALQGKKIDRLRGLENALNDDVKAIASARLADTQRALTTGTSLSAAVLLSSILLAWLIGRGVSRSVSSLTDAAAKVQRDKDYGARARKVSRDELGMLTDAFNEMLAGIQARDSELENHRENLEQLVEERTAALSARNEAMRIVLDNVEEGLATIDLDGTLSTETSKAFARWFGTPASNTQLHSHLEKASPKVAAMTEVAWDCVKDDMLPWDLCLEQMPSELTHDGRHFRLAYRGIGDSDKLERALLVVKDITEELARAQRDAVQQEMLALFSRITEDRTGFVEFMTDAKRLVQATREREKTSIAELMRTVHTIKGNCNIVGVTSVGQAAHELESFIVENSEVPADAAFQDLYAAWEAFEERVAPMLADRGDLIEITESDIQALDTAIDRGEGKEGLRARVAALRFEPVEKRLARIGERAKALAKRLGKGNVRIVIEADDERLPPAEEWNNFFGSLVHAIRNAVDHGLESPAERKQAGKPEQAEIALRFKRGGGQYQIELQDDGRGIDWDRLVVKAKERGLKVATEAERIEALFADGVSSRDAVSDQSGRGVGMAALREAVSALAGKVTVKTERGKGTTLHFAVPRTATTGKRRVA